MTQYPAAINLSSLNGTNGFVMSGEQTGDFAGRVVSTAGDINGDGIPDLIIGGDNNDANGVNNAGAGYVVFGQVGGFSANLDLSTLNGTNGFKISGAVGGDYMGEAVSAAGDINGDGFGDLIVGAYDAAGQVSQSGAAYVVFGKASGFAANLDVTALTGANGFKLSGETISDAADGARDLEAIGSGDAGEIQVGKA